MVAQVMKEGKIKKIVVGADNLAKNGDIANKIGTYQIALLAKEFKIPFYVICPPESSAKSGKDIKIEIRPDKELFKIGSKTIAPSGLKGYYPAFDITPNDLITKHIYMEV
jgi:methylthioribose-1-phosphate isomerase